MPVSQLRHWLFSALLAFIFSLFFPLNTDWITITIFIILGSIGADIDFLFRNITSTYLNIQRLFHHLFAFILFTILLTISLTLNIKYLSLLLIFYMTHMFLDIISCIIYYLYDEKRPQPLLIILHRIICGKYDPRTRHNLKYLFKNNKFLFCKVLVFGGLEKLYTIKNCFRKYWFLS